MAARTVDPLPKDGLSRCLRQEHASCRNGVCRHEGGHAAREEHLLARRRVDDRVDRLLRFPHLFISCASWKRSLLFEFLEQRLRGCELLVGYEQLQTEMVEGREIHIVFFAMLSMQSLQSLHTLYKFRAHKGSMGIEVKWARSALTVRGSTISRK